MSYAVSWIAVRGKGPREVRQTLGLHASGVWREEARCPIAGATLPTGWYLVRAEGSASVLSDPTLVWRLSEMCELVSCWMNEEQNLSAAGQWKDGERLWNIRYDAKRANGCLETHGTLPLGFETVTTELLAKAEGPDAKAFFEVPIDVAEAVTGYRDGASPPKVLDHRYELLIAENGPQARSTRGWWKRLFSPKK